MSHVHRDDADLLARAREGDATAFAALLHRHGPAVHAALSEPATAGEQQGSEAWSAVTAEVSRTFLEAIRRIEYADETDVQGWLLRLALGDDPTPDALARAQEPEPLPATVLDEVWDGLAARWPTGRRPLRLPRWVGRAALLVVLLGLAAGVPYVVLVTASDRDDTPPPISEVDAVPHEVEDDRANASTTDTDTASPDNGDPLDDLDRE
ncbi:MAG: hypothetical protein WD638_13555 [Nitriliruptoraceae bacterium]